MPGDHVYRTVRSACYRATSRFTAARLVIMGSQTWTRGDTCHSLEKRGPLAPPRKRQKWIIVLDVVRKSYPIDV